MSERRGREEGREGGGRRKEKEELLLKDKRKEGKEEGGKVGRGSFACLDRLTKSLSHTHSHAYLHLQHWNGRCCPVTRK